VEVGGQVVKFVFDIAQKLFHDVFHGDHAHDPVFGGGHQGDVDFLFHHLFQHLSDGGISRDAFDGAHDALDRGHAGRHFEGNHQILEIDVALDALGIVVHRSYRKAGMQVQVCLQQGVGQGAGNRHHGNIACRQEHIFNRA